MTRDIDLQQTLNTLSKIENMAIVTRDRIATGIETIQELEDDYQRMDKLRNVRRIILAEGGIVEIIMRNFEYYPNHKAACRAALKTIVSLVGSDFALNKLMDKSIAEEKEYDRRVAGVKVKEVTFTRVEKKRGLGVLNSAIKEILPDKNQSQTDDPINPKENKMLQETQAALQFVIEAELTPRLPLTFARATALFHDDDVIQEYIEDLSDAIRGIHYPMQRIGDIIKQAETFLLAKYPKIEKEIDKIDEAKTNNDDDAKNMETDGINRSNSEVSESRLSRSSGRSNSKNGSKYRVKEKKESQNGTKKKGKKKKKKEKKAAKIAKTKTTTVLEPYPFVKGDRVEAKLIEYWRKRYAGTVTRARRTKHGFIYTVTFDDGEIVKKIPYNKARKTLYIPSLQPINCEESLRTLLRIAEYPRWQTRPDLQTLCLRAMKLVLDCGDEKATSKDFVMLNGINIVISAMTLFPRSARLNIRASQLLCGVILGPTRTYGAKMQQQQEEERAAAREEVPQTTSIIDDYDFGDAHVQNFDIDRDKQNALNKLQIIEIQSKCAKAFGTAGAITLLCSVMRHDFLDDVLNTTVRKQGVWALHCLSSNRNNIKIIEACGGMYVLKLAGNDKEIVISRRLKLINWKMLREQRLAGGIDDELEKIAFLKDLYVDCIHVNAGMACENPNHCKQCFVNLHATGFWHKIGCKAHPGNTDVCSLLQMQQMNIAKDHHWANVADVKNELLRKEREKEAAKGAADGGTRSKISEREIPEEWT